MTDDELDRRLRLAMSVAPSIDLTARVRSRIAEEPVRSPVWRWVPAAAGGALAMVGVVVVAIIARPPLLDSPSAGLVAPERAAAVPAGIEGVDTGRADFEGLTVPTRTPRRATAVAPEAQTRAPRFAPGDAEAFRVLLAFSRAALATTGVEPSEVSMPEAPLVLQPLDIQPVAIAPLVLVDTTVEGGPQ